MRPAFLALAALSAAALALYAGCKMPALPEGYQLSCAEDGECPGGMVCSRTCCVTPGQRPTCATNVGVGTGCSGGCPGVDGGCPGSCPAYLACFDEPRVGFTGGLCSRGCAEDDDCPAVTVEGFEQDRVMDCVDVQALMLPESKLCLRRCSAEADHSSDCRPGWACDCPASGPCHCLPRCSAADGGNACGPAPDGGVMECEATTGLCRAPVPPGPDAGPDAGPEDASLPDFASCLAAGYYSDCADYCTRAQGQLCQETCPTPGDDAGTTSGTITFETSSITPCTVRATLVGDCHVPFGAGVAYACCCK